MKEFHYHRSASADEVSNPKNFEKPEHAEIFKKCTELEIDLKNKFWGWGIEMKKYSYGDPFIVSEKVDIIFFKEESYASIISSGYSFLIDQFDKETVQKEIQKIVEEL